MYSEKIFEGEISIRIQLTTFLQIVCEFMFYSKSVIVPDNYIDTEIFRHQCVNMTWKKNRNFGHPYFYGGQYILKILTIKMCKYIKIRHNIVLQCHGNYMEMKKFNYIREIDIFINSSQFLGVSWGLLIKGLGVQKDTQTPCWLNHIWKSTHLYSS